VRNSIPYLSKKAWSEDGEVPIKTIYGKEKSEMKVTRDTCRFPKTVFSMKLKSVFGKV